MRGAPTLCCGAFGGSAGGRTSDSSLIVGWTTPPMLVSVTHAMPLRLHTISHTFLALSLSLLLSDLFLPPSPSPPLSPFLYPHISLSLSPSRVPFFLSPPSLLFLPFPRPPCICDQDRQVQADTMKEVIHKMIWEGLGAKAGTTIKQNTEVYARPAVSSALPGAESVRSLDALAQAAASSLGAVKTGGVTRASLVGKEVQEGWRVVSSRTRQGEVSFENIHTEERIAWLPLRPASRTEGNCM